MEEDLDVIHACCICHRQAEARWCFCRDKNAVYCSSECQRDGWPVHKQVCSWNVAKIQYRILRNKLAVSPSNSQGQGHLNKLKNTIQISHHPPRGTAHPRAQIRHRSLTYISLHSFILLYNDSTLLQWKTIYVAFASVAFAITGMKRVGVSAGTRKLFIAA